MIRRSLFAMIATAVVPVIGACTSKSSVPRPLHGDNPRVEITRVGDGVFAMARREPLALAGNANSLVIIGPRDVTVVDAQFTREATLETLAAIRTLTSRPVRYVVNTHWHDDHFAGNQVYRDSFPDVEFVLHANTIADLRSLGAPNRGGTRTGAPPLVAEFERRLAVGLGVDSTPVSPAERDAMMNANRIMRRYLDELPGFREEAAGITVRDRVSLGAGASRVDVRWFGKANTRGDLVVHVVEQGIVATGDLVVWPVPFAFGSHPAEWVAVLDSVARLDPRVLVPGHGPVQRDLSYLGKVRSVLTAVRDSTGAAVTRGDSLPKVLREVRLEAYRKQFGADDEKWRGWMFENFFRVPAVSAAYRQGTAR